MWRMGIREDAAHVLLTMAGHQQFSGDTKRGHYGFDGENLAKETSLPSERINDAVEVLEGEGYVEVAHYLGTAPFDFGDVELTSRGRMEAERIGKAQVNAARSGGPSRVSREQPVAESEIARTYLPVGSPYGFTDQDWEAVRLARADPEHLIVVFGHQWTSNCFDTTKLRENVGSVFSRSLGRSRPGLSPGLALDYRPLKGGYGEHLFNEIARNIMSADIAVFETSDLNPNVMIEMGVALTWGIRVLPIRAVASPKPPSDISGQTWAEYEESASTWPDPEHQTKIDTMVERAVHKKPQKK